MNSDVQNTSGKTIQEKIARACHLAQGWGDALRNDAAVQRLMARLKANLAASFQAMIETGIVQACTRCDEEDGGSCCGAGIENRYNETLLLLNLLLGVDLPSERLQEGSCFFLGEEGCGLKVREVLCVNYLCQAIQKSMEPSHRDLIQEAVGAELETVFLLQEAARRVLRCAGALES